MQTRRIAGASDTYGDAGYRDAGYMDAGRIAALRPWRLSTGMAVGETLSKVSLLIELTYSVHGRAAACPEVSIIGFRSSETRQHHNLVGEQRYAELVKRTS